MRDDAIALSCAVSLWACSTKPEASPPPAPAEPQKLLSVSFGFTKALFADYNELRAHVEGAHWAGRGRRAIAWPVRNADRGRGPGQARPRRADARESERPRRQLFAKHSFRPRLAAVAARTKSQFPQVEPVKSDAVVGSWAQLEQEHFGSHGIFNALRGDQARTKN